MNIIRRIFPGHGSIRQRLFWILGGLGLGTLLLVNLIWLPGAIREIHEAQAELQKVAVRGMREQIQTFLEGREYALKSQAVLFRTPFLEGDRKALRLLAYHFLQRELAFEEIGIVDAQGQEHLWVSRTRTITDRDLGNRSASLFFRHGLHRDVFWEPAVTTETSEPWVTLAVPLRRSEATPVGLIFGVINLKSLWELTGAFTLSRGGRAYVVDELGLLLAADDPNLVLKQLSFADRPLVRHLTDFPHAGTLSLVQGSYTNEYKVPVLATGSPLPGPRWAVFVEQPESLLYAPIRQKLWFFCGLSVMGLVVSFGLAHLLSHRLTEPITRLRQGVEQIASGHLEHQVTVERSDEIGELAGQFNQMAHQLRQLFTETEGRAREQAALHTVTAAVSASLDLDEILGKTLDTILEVTGMEAGHIRFLEGEPPRLTLKVHRGLSPQHVERLRQGTRVGGKSEQVLTTQRPFILENVPSEQGETLQPVTSKENFTAAAWIPILSQEKAVGLMNVGSWKRKSFSRDQIILLESIGAALGVALERAQLYGEIKEHAATLEQKVRERTAALEEASRHKSEFLANMSHELRTPLNAVIGFSEVLEDQTFGPLNPKQLRYAQNIHSSGQHLLRLINDILDLSKVEAGKMEIRPEEVGLRGAIEEVMAALKPLAEKKQLTLEVTLTGGATALLADPGKLRQILYNLLSNAVKFTPEGGRVTVAARRAVDPQFVTLTVTDTGIGIAPADLPRLFQEFIQLDSSVSKQYEGTGLGLALTKKLVELHGGTIAVESPGRGGGTTATVTLPSPMSPSPSESAAPSPTALPVLVIEDDPKAINLLTLHLTQAGYRVAVARDAPEALAQARQLLPFAITLDILMPGTDGWGILQALKTDPLTQAIPVIVISIVDEEKLGLTLGALEYLVKPLKKEALLKILDRLTLSPRGRGRPLRVLVVDDEPSVRELLRAILTPLGVTVLTAAGGAEGLAAVRAEPPDLLILDLMMPQMSGFEVVEALRADPATAQLPIVINTAKTLTPAEQAFLTRHIQALFIKGGYAPEALIRELAKVAKGPGGRGKA